VENRSETDNAAKCCDHDVEESVGSKSESESDDAATQGDHDGEENVKERANGVEGMG